MTGTRGHNITVSIIQKHQVLCTGMGTALDKKADSLRLERTEKNKPCLQKTLKSKTLKIEEKNKQTVFAELITWLPRSSWSDLH